MVVCIWKCWMIISFRNRFNFDGSRSSTCFCHFELYFFSFAEAAFALDLRVMNKDFFAIFAFNEAVASHAEPSCHCTLCRVFHLFCSFCLYFLFGLFIPSFVMTHKCESTSFCFSSWLKRFILFSLLIASHLVLNSAIYTSFSGLYILVYLAPFPLLCCLKRFSMSLAYPV